MISSEEKCGDIIVVTVSDIGFNHFSNNISNQDSVGYTVIGEDFVLALSDGVGSCKKAKTGSEAAILSAKKVFSDVKRGIIKIDFHVIVNRLITEWKLFLSKEIIGDCCATLSIAMKLGDRLLLFSVGDSLLAVTSGEIKICSPEDNKLFANQTLCLCESVSSADFWTKEVMLKNNDNYVVFVCSDGVSNGIQLGREIELVKEIEMNITEGRIKQELESLVLDISEFSADDRTIGVVKYERKNEGSFR
jgi:serine/threonine protein phosphatase PrpC